MIDEMKDKDRNSDPVCYPQYFSFPLFGVGGGA